MSTSTADPVGSAKRFATPVIVDLGKISRKNARRLKKGSGPYLKEVEPAVAEVAANLGKDGGGKQILPVVVVYEKKRKRSSLPKLKFFR